MGSSSSKFEANRHVSKPDSEVENLSWVVGELEGWQQMGNREKLEQKLTKEQHSQHPRGAWHVVCSKFLFVNGMLEELQRACVDLFKLQAKKDRTERQIKESTSPKEAHESLLLSRQAKEEKVAAMGAFDNARSAVEWLQNDCVLHIRARGAEEQIKHIRALSRRIDPDEFQELYAARLLTLQRQQEQISEELQENEAMLLCIGLHYLDKNLSGEIEVDDIPDMDLGIFVKLDRRHRHRIGAADLEHAIADANSSIAKNTKRIRQLQGRIDTLCEKRSLALNSLADLKVKVRQQRKAKVQKAKEKSSTTPAGKHQQTHVQVEQPQVAVASPEKASESDTLLDSQEDETAEESRPERDDTSDRDFVDETEKQQTRGAIPMQEDDSEEDDDALGILDESKATFKLDKQLQEIEVQLEGETNQLADAKKQIEKETDFKRKVLQVFCRGFVQNMFTQLARVEPSRVCPALHETLGAHRLHLGLSDDGLEQAVRSLSQRSPSQKQLRSEMLSDTGDAEALHASSEELHEAKPDAKEEPTEETPEAKGAEADARDSQAVEHEAAPISEAKQQGMAPDLPEGSDQEEAQEDKEVVQDKQAVKGDQPLQSPSIA